MSVTAAEGFVAAGCHAGVKRKRYDMALVSTEDRKAVTAAAVFTQNKFAAPPVVLDRRLLGANGGRAAAVIVNSGNANAGTGKPGYRDAQLMAAATGEALQIANSHVMVCSTGIIGTPLPMDLILKATPNARPSKRSTHSERNRRRSSNRSCSSSASVWRMPSARCRPGRRKPRSRANASLRKRSSGALAS